MTTEPLPPFIVETAVTNALNEDFGRVGDITSQSIISESAVARTVIASRQIGILAGLDLALMSFKKANDTLQFKQFIQDGEQINIGDKILEISGAALPILAAERVALNFLGHLSGIASLTHKFVEAISGNSARICCTRKTTPGLRVLEKYAVRVGGGVNHRFGLDDGILIKDNHIAIAGSVRHALEQAHKKAGHMLPIEIEVDTLTQLNEALTAGAKIILLDNMSPEILSEAVKLIGNRATSEASGGVSLENVNAIAQTGVDYISVGQITHSSKCIDFGLDFIP